MLANWRIRLLYFWVIVIVFAVVSGAASPESTNSTENSSQHPAPRALLVSREHALLSSQVAARIQKLALREGESFKKGDILVQFDCAVWQAHLQKANAALRAAQTKLDVQRKLSKIQSASLLEVELAQAEMVQAQGETYIYQETIKHCSIYAPFDGKIAALKARPHESVPQGGELMEIMNPQTLEVEILMPTRWLATVSTGSPLTLYLDEQTSPFTIRVVRLSSQVHPVNQTLKVIAKLEKPSPKLLAGMSGHVIRDTTPP